MKQPLKRLNSGVYFTVRPGFSMLSVCVRCTPPYLSPTSLSSFHQHANNHPHVCCPPPILPHPPFLVVTSARRRAPPWRKYSSAPFFHPASPHTCVSSVSWFHNSLCIAPCVSETNIPLGNVFKSFVCFVSFFFKCVWDVVCHTKVFDGQTH